jgi:hypothetical protein
MASVVEICNQALAELPDAPIASLDEASLQARQCKRVYGQCLSEMLELHEWGFANRRVVLAGIPNDRPNEWAYAYALPSGIGTPGRLVPDLSSLGLGAIPVQADDTPPYYETWAWPASAYPSDYIIDATTIYANVDGAILEYGAATVSPTEMSALFVRALALEIASRLAMPLNKSRELKGDLIKQAEVAKDRAKADDMNRQPQRVPSYVPDAKRARGWG